MIDKTTRLILCTAFAPGKTHDFALFKASRLPVCCATLVQVDSGYLGLTKWHQNVQLPHKTTKLHPLTPQLKDQNRKLAQERVPIEAVFGWLKRFAILRVPYRNHLARLSLRFNLLAALYNLHL